MTRRAGNFSLLEVSYLLKLVTRYNHILQRRDLTKSVWEEKATTWQKIEREFNSKFRSVYRSAKVLRTKFDNLKKAARRNSASGNKSNPSNVTKAASLNEMIGATMLDVLQSETPTRSTTPQDVGIDVIEIKEENLSDDAAEDDYPAEILGDSSDTPDVVLGLDNFVHKYTVTLQSPAEECLSTCKRELSKDSCEIEVPSKKSNVENKCQNNERELAIKKLEMEIEFAQEEHRLRVLKHNLEIEALTLQIQLLKKQIDK